MVDQVRSSAGSTISIADAAGAPATFDAVGYEALTYIKIGQVTEIPEFGTSRNVIEHMPLDTIDIVKLKGSRNNGSMSVPYAVVDSDSGQDAVDDAEASEEAYAFVVETQSGTKRYFMGKVFGNTVTVGDVDSVTTGSITVELDTKPVKVLPSPPVP